MLSVEKIKEAVAQKRLHMHVNVDNGMRTFKYKKDVFWEGTWDEVTEECRGLVLDKDWNIVAYPLTKIYNYGIEARAPKFDPSEIVLVMEKVNGFMLSVFVHEGQVKCSTTGSTNSDFVKLGEKWIDRYNLQDKVHRLDGYTWIFECVDESDPHIVPEKPGLYLLAKRKNEFGSVVSSAKSWEAMKLGAMYPYTRYMRMHEVVDYVKHCKTEGVVVYASDGRSTKIKSPYYLVQKMLARSRTDRLLSPGAKQRIDEEYYPLLAHVQTNVDEFSALDEQARLEFCRKFLNNYL